MTRKRFFENLTGPTHHSRLWLHLVTGTGIGLIALGYALNDLDFVAVQYTLSTISWPWILASLLSVIAVTLAKAVRWRALYGVKRAEIALQDVFTVLAISQMINLVIPIRVGELTRLGLMKQAGQPGAVTLSTIVIEKTLDMVAVGFLAVSLVTLTVAPTWLQDSAGGSLFTGLLLLLGLILIGRRHTWVERLLARLLTWRGWLPASWQQRVLGTIKNMLVALGSLADLPSLALMSLWTLIAWLLPLVTMLTLFAAFRLDLPFTAAVAMMLGLTLSYLVPTLPGRVGVRQMIAVMILGQYQVSQPVANGLGLILNIVTVVPLIIMGSLVLWPRLSLIFKPDQETSTFAQTLPSGQAQNDRI